MYVQKLLDIVWFHLFNEQLMKAVLRVLNGFQARTVTQDFCEPILTSLWDLASFQPEICQQFAGTENSL